MPEPSTPRTGRVWPTPTETARSWARRTATRVAAPLPGDDFEAELASDLAVLVECGLVVPIYDGGTVRYALASTADQPVRS